MIRPIRYVIGIAVGVLIACAALLAHHGGAVEWQMGKSVGPLTGTVTKFNFVYPHPSILFDVKTPAGELQHWAGMLRPTPAILREHGWTRNSMKPGDTITITLTPHKTAPFVGNARRIEVNGTLLSDNVGGMIP
jgi:hypothetical protein